MENNIFALKASCAEQLINEILKGQLTDTDEILERWKKFFPKRERGIC